MDMKLGMSIRDLSNAFVTREKEIYADAKNKEKKKQKAKILKKKSNKDGFKRVFENFHSIDLLG